MNRMLLYHHFLTKPKLFIPTDSPLVYDLERTVEKYRNFRASTYLNWDELEFTRQFHMSQDNVRALLHLIEDLLPVQYDGMGSAVIPPMERLIMVLWYLTSHEPMCAVAVRFGTTDSVVAESTDLVCQCINLRLQNIVLPNRDDYKSIAEKFIQANGFPGIVGAIDGTYIPIKKPNQEPDVYVNRKGFHSLNVLAMCDGYGRFRYFYSGCPGSFHDARVLQESQLYEWIEYLPPGYHVLGDSAYPLEMGLVVPYKAPAVEKLYNYIHSANRIIIENAFGHLKLKFSRIRYRLEVNSIEKANLIIETCLKLHNFIIDQTLLNDTQRSIEDDIPVNHYLHDIDGPINKKTKRDHIKSIIQQLHDNVPRD